MWWIILISILVPAIIVGTFVVLIIISKIKHQHGDYNDGGGIHIGAHQRVSFFTPANDRAGIVGEKRVNYYLRPLLRNDEYLLTNLLLPLWNGEKAEIDCVLVSRKGIFCIEIKHWVGHISGNDEDEFWLQEYDDPYRKNKYRKNPIKQNDFHCTIIKEKLNIYYPINNVVIFYRLEYGRRINSKYIYTVWKFRDYYRSLDSNVIPESSLKIIYQKLKPYIATLEQLQRHRKMLIK